METTVDILSQVIAELRKERDDFEELYQSQVDNQFKVCKELHIANEKVRRLSLGKDNPVCLTCPESQWARQQQDLQDLNNFKQLLMTYQATNKQLKQELEDSIDNFQELAKVAQDKQVMLQKLEARIEELATKWRKAETDKLEILQSGYARK